MSDETQMYDMNFRDYAAVAAMQGMLQGRDLTEMSQTVVGNIARTAYRMAQAICVEREHQR